MQHLRALPMRHGSHVSEQSCKQRVVLHERWEMLRFMFEPHPYKATEMYAREISCLVILTKTDLPFLVAKGIVKKEKKK
jgi:hypothetical protein